LIRLSSSSDQEGEVRINLPPRDLVLGLIAENVHAASEPAFAQLRWAGGQPDQEFVLRPKLYVLAIGNSDYENPDLDLDFPAKDAQDFAEAVRTQSSSGLYRDIEVKILRDAAKSGVLKGLEWLEHSVTSIDLAMLFMAGHGVNDNNGLYYTNHSHKLSFSKAWKLRVGQEARALRWVV
ncbi:MAG: caspase family protein, partial [Gammaproteobacteria bacterium]